MKRSAAHLSTLFAGLSLAGAGVAAPSTCARQDDSWTQEELEAIAAEIQKDVEDLRGQQFLRPVEVKIADAETFLAHATERMESLMTPEMIAGYETMSRMLGFVPPDMDVMDTLMELLEEQVGGYYVPGDDVFYLMEGFTGGLAKVILAHELTHALDDQLFDIDGGLEALLDNSDATFAYSAVVEGSGTSLMNRWTMHAIREGGLDLGDADSMAQMGTEAMEKAPPFLWVPLLGAYMRGASFLVESDSVMQGQMKGAETEDIVQAFEHPPASSEQILHPEKYWSEEAEDAPRRVEFVVGHLPSDWEVLHQDTLGEIHLAFLTIPAGQGPSIDPANPMSFLSIEYTNELVAGWGGDRLILLGDGEKRYLRLVTAWDSERDAAEFYGGVFTRLGALEEQLEAVAELELGEDGRARPEVSLEYGEHPDEVILTLHFGLRRSEVRGIEDGLVHRVGAAAD